MTEAALGARAGSERQPLLHERLVFTGTAFDSQQLSTATEQAGGEGWLWFAVFTLGTGTLVSAQPSAASSNCRPERVLEVTPE